MQLKCISAFGNAKPGDVVDGIPDGAVFDRDYWEEVVPAPAAAAPAPAKPAAAAAPAPAPAAPAAPAPKAAS